jgi:hypothetical protein
MSENILKEAEDVPDVMNAKLFVNYMPEKIPGKCSAQRDTHHRGRRVSVWYLKKVLFRCGVGEPPGCTKAGRCLYG